MGIRLKTLIWCALTALLTAYLTALYINNNIKIDSNILSLLPATENDIAVEQAFENISETGMRRLVFMVEANDLKKAKQGAKELGETLRKSRWISEIALRHDNENNAAIAEIYFNYRFHLLSKKDALLLAEGDYEKFSDEVIRQIFSPFSGGLTELVQTDPFLLSYRLAMKHVDNRFNNFSLDDGYLVNKSDNKSYVLLTAMLTETPFNQGLQKQILNIIKKVEDQWGEHAVNTRLLRTGALFYTAYAYDTARQEVSMIGGSSMLLILILLLLTFRSIRPVALIVVTLGFGIASGFASVRLLFGEVHLLTIVFGSSLIGVAVDYAFHYFAVANTDSIQDRLRLILPTISLGLLSSVIGYLALFITPFPGLQQMAIFCISGLIGAYVTVVLLFPTIPLKITISPILINTCQRFIMKSVRLPSRRLLKIALLFPLIAAVVLINHTNAHDDVRNFQAKNISLQKQERIIQDLLQAPATNQFYLVKGSSPEDLLLKLEGVQTRLDSLVERGAIEAYLNIADWLPSIQQQAQNYQLYEGLYQSEVAASLVDTGLITGDQFRRAAEIFAMAKDNYIYPDTWLQSPLGKKFSYLWQGGGNDKQSYTSIIALRGIKRLDLLSELDAGKEGHVVFVDKLTTVNNILALYRSNVAILLLIACGAIFIILSLRYGPGKAAIILSSPIIAVSVVLICVVLLDKNISLFNILPLFLVVGIGVDFGIIFAETGIYSPRTVLVVLLSALTTMLSFGLLSLSATTVIQSFGFSMLLGISSVLLLSPIIGNLVANTNNTQLSHM